MRLPAARLLALTVVPVTAVLALTAAPAEAATARPALPTCSSLQSQADEWWDDQAEWDAIGDEYAAINDYPDATSWWATAAATRVRYYAVIAVITTFC
jgi:hypothetical protein